MIGIGAFFNLALPALVISRTAYDIAKRLEERSKRLFFTEFWVKLRPENPETVLAYRREQQWHVPVQNALAETVEILGDRGQVLGRLQPGPERYTLDGDPQDPKTVLLGWPEYRIDRVLLVYPEVLKWLEQHTRRPLDDLATYDQVRTVEMGEDGTVIGCSGLKAAIREGETTQRQAVSMSEACGSTATLEQLIGTLPEVEDLGICYGERLEEATAIEAVATNEAVAVR